MPIFANNFFVGNTEIEANGVMISNSDILVEPVPHKPVSIKRAAMAPVAPLKNTQEKHNKDESLLIVDGKEKKISRQSQYILDMLSLDNE